MEEAKKPAGKKAARKPAASAAGHPAPRARKATTASAVEPGFQPASAPAREDVRPDNGRAAAASRPRLSPEERHRLIAEAAYFRASQRGFRGGAEVEDWLAAEAEIDSKLLGR
jgi:hypothetical protein